MDNDLPVLAAVNESPNPSNADDKSFSPSNWGDVNVPQGAPPPPTGASLNGDDGGIFKDDLAPVDPAEGEASG